MGEGLEGYVWVMKSLPDEATTYLIIEETDLDLPWPAERLSVVL